MNDTQTAHPRLDDPRRFGESLSSMAHDLDLPPRDAWRVVDAVWIARLIEPTNPVGTALIMAQLQSASARCLALFYALLLDSWTIEDADHNVILRLVDPAFDPDWASE